jgi:hypothetical protein
MLDYDWTFKNGWIYFKTPGQIVPYAIQFNRIDAAQTSNTSGPGKIIRDVAKLIKKSPVYMDIVDSVKLVDMLY